MVCSPLLIALCNTQERKVVNGTGTQALRLTCAAHVVSDAESALDRATASRSPLTSFTRASRASCAADTRRDSSSDRAEAVRAHEDAMRASTAVDSAAAVRAVAGVHLAGWAVA